MTNGESGPKKPEIPKHRSRSVVEAWAQLDRITHNIAVRPVKYDIEQVEILLQEDDKPYEITTSKDHNPVLPTVISESSAATDGLVTRIKNKFRPRPLTTFKENSIPALHASLGVHEWLTVPDSGVLWAVDITVPLNLHHNPGVFPQVTCEPLLAGSDSNVDTAKSVTYRLQHSGLEEYVTDGESGQWQPADDMAMRNMVTMLRTVNNYTPDTPA